MRRLITSLALALAVLLDGCASAPHAPPGLFDAQYNAPYTLASGDRLRVIVFGQDALSNSYAVDGSGNISLPLVGFIRAQDLTTQAMERSIEEHLRNGFLREPRVAVEVEAYRPFYVIGEVAAAGQYPFVNGMTVQNAIAIAGGFGPRGARQSAEITRSVDGQIVTGTVAMTQPVRPGDTISVRERFF